MLTLDLESIEHEANMLIARMIGICREELLGDFASTFQKVFAEGVDVDLDGDIFAISRIVGTAPENDEPPGQ